MGPKPTAKHRKEKLGKELAAFLDEHTREADLRYQELLRKAEDIYLKMSEDFVRAAEEILPKEVLDANLFEFLDSTVTPDPEEDQFVGTNVPSENIEITSDAVTAFENLSIPVEKVSPDPEVVRDEIVRAPLQENVSVPNVPPIIRPNVEDLRAGFFRRPKQGEVVFSLDGSPLVSLPACAPDKTTRVMKQILESEEGAFTPNTREAVSCVKALIRRKVEQDKRDSQELDLSSPVASKCIRYK